MLCWPLLWDVIRVHPCNKDYHEHSLHPDTLAEPTAHHRSKSALQYSALQISVHFCMHWVVNVHFIKLIQSNFKNCVHLLLQSMQCNAVKSRASMNWEAAVKINLWDGSGQSRHNASCKAPIQWEAEGGGCGSKKQINQLREMSTANLP